MTESPTIYSVDQDQLRDAMETLGFVDPKTGYYKPGAFARALGIPYDTLKNWLNGRASIPKVGQRCVELLLRHPEDAKELSVRVNKH